MVAINEILLRECTGEGCGGDNDICTDSLVHHRNAENRAPVTRNRRSAPLLGRWLTRDPIGYQGGINLYGYVDSGPVVNLDATGLKTIVVKIYGATIAIHMGLSEGHLSFNMSINQKLFGVEVGGVKLGGNGNFNFKCIAKPGTNPGIGVPRISMKTQISWSPFSLTTTLTSRDGPFVGHDTLKATVPLWGGNDTLTVSGGSKYYYYFSFLGKNYKLSMSLAVTGSGKLNSGIVGATVITVLAAELAALSPDILAAIMLILAQLALRTLVPAFEGQL